MLCPPYLHMSWAESAVNTSEYNAVQYNTSTNYEICVNTWILINTSMTVSTKTVRKSDQIRLHRCS